MSLTRTIGITEMSGLDGIQQELESFCESSGVAAEPQIEVATALEELVVNAFKHGKASSVEVSFGLADGELAVTIADDGCAFNPLEQAAPDLSVPLEQRQAGGMGIHLVRNLTDAQSYRRENGRNIFEMSKKL